MIDFILRPFRRNFGKDKRFYAAIDDMFGFIPNNIELYKLALIHKSASITMEDGSQVNNERLEYLGDAVIESVTSDYLFIEFPDKNEGFLTQLRSKMVSRQTLNEVAKRIGLDDYVISHTSNNVSQKHIYGDAFEAMMGAIYLDQGYDFVNRLLINKIFVDYIKVDNLTEAETDFKSRLIEWCQKNHHQIHFSTHNDKNFSSSHPSFYSKVLIDNIEVGYGVGDSKKEAEQRAAFSVAQGVNDDDCTKLMDKLDLLEAQNLGSAEKGKPAAKKEHNKKKREAEPVVGPTVEEQPKTLAEEAVQEEKPMKKAAVKRQRKPEKPQAEESAVSAMAEAVTADTENVAKENIEKISGEPAESEDKSKPKTSGTKKSSKPRAKRPSKPANEAIEKGENSEKKEDNTKAEKPKQASKPRAKKVKNEGESNKTQAITSAEAVPASQTKQTNEESA